MKTLEFIPEVIKRIGYSSRYQLGCDSAVHENLIGVNISMNRIKCIKDIPWMCIRVFDDNDTITYKIFDNLKETNTHIICSSLKSSQHN